MAEITRFTQDDIKPIHALYRRVFGPDAAAANQLRWDWQYRRNPCVPSGGPLTWVAREGATVVGQHATMPVRLWVKGREILGAWATDVMVAPERQRQGLGDVLVRTWEQHVGAALGLGHSESSAGLLRKLGWPNVGPVPVMVKPLTRRALRQPNWPLWMNRFVSAIALPLVRITARSKPLRAEVVPLRRFGDEFTVLWDRLAPKFDFAVRRDAPYLNWKFLEPPHIRYSLVALKRAETLLGYAVYRHLHEPRGRVTLLVDFLVDPDDELGVKTLLRWIDREARAADTDKIRAVCMHDGYRRIMRRSGYFRVRSPLEFTARVKAFVPSADFYSNTAHWHVTLGDGDQDR